RRAHPPPRPPSSSSAARDRLSPALPAAPASPAAARARLFPAPLRLAPCLPRSVPRQHKVRRLRPPRLPRFKLRQPAEDEASDLKNQVSHWKKLEVILPESSYI
ncbi:unnamed protein product, partial [Urochloa humidicola]